MTLARIILEILVSIVVFVLAVCSLVLSFFYPVFFLLWIFKH